ncbi:SRPBCC family protein [Prauserella halophila]|uniref:SRPBCC family protein n=1 Tax=Prauserella halophila TaxID=185641 RepID=A0ABP4GK55_9PSEU|nr:SRPBCC family protein [Prauserella halophila]MCP2237213.1 Polyketide cyclase / dehydrase and lipid transport [Prauserella halophila]
MPRWHSLAPSDDTFLSTARFRFRHTVDLRADTEQVWRVLTADNAPATWARGITGAVWTSPRPFGVGTTRTVTVAHGAAALRERFYRWDEGVRMSFSAEAANRPGLHRFAEDITLCPHSDGTRLVWTFALEPRRMLMPLLAPIRPVLLWVTGEWTREVGKHAPARGPGRPRR